MLFPNASSKWFAIGLATVETVRVSGILMDVSGALGPNTLIGLGKGKADKAALVKKLVPHYVALLKKLKELGVSEVQLHEPILVTPGANKYQVQCKATFGCCA